MIKTFTANMLIGTLALAHLVLAAQPADAHGLVRREQSGLAIESSISVPAGAEFLFIGGTLADVADSDKAPGAVVGLGDTAAQARSILGKIKAELAAAGYAMSDIVKMDVYLVGDPDKAGAVDMLGLLSAYVTYFGKEPGGLPARTIVQVAGLPLPGALVQMAVTAAHSNHTDHQ